MKKVTTLIPLLLVMIILSACDDDNNAPVKQLHAQSMSYGEFNYRILRYNAQNQVSSITSGMLVDGDSSKNIHQIIYEGDKVKKIEIANEWTLEYFYENGLISETREYRDGAPLSTHIYMYDANGHVSTWAVLNQDGDKLVPFTKTTYTYREDGNMIAQKFFYYGGSDYRLLHTVFFEDFDDKKSISGLFMTDLYNLYDEKFKNNARVWRLVNENGSTSEEHFQFEYNAQGYVTRSTPDAGHGTTYRYLEH